MIDHDSARFTVEPFWMEQWPEVRPLMLSGYARSDAGWWDCGIARIRDTPPNGEHAPLGVVLRRAGELVGAALMFHSRRPGDAAQRWVISASSWVILDPWRSRALSMARQAMADEQQLYTALTPIPSAQRMLQRVGFRPICHQMMVSDTWRWRSGPAPRTPVCSGPEALSVLAAHPLAAALRDHDRLGLLVMALQTEHGWEPLVWRRVHKLRWLQAAELIFTRSQAMVSRHAGAIGGELKRRGYPLMAFEGHEDLLVEHRCTRLFQRRFARGPYACEGIDHLYSELVYLHR